MIEALWKQNNSKQHLNSHWKISEGQIAKTPPETWGLARHFQLTKLSLVWPEAPSSLLVCVELNLIVWFGQQAEKSIFTQYYTHMEILGYDLTRHQVAFSAISSLFSNNWPHKKKGCLNYNTHSCFAVLLLPGCLSCKHPAWHLDGENGQNPPKIINTPSSTCCSSTPHPRCYQINNTFLIQILKMAKLQRPRKTEATLKQGKKGSQFRNKLSPAVRKNAQ